MNGRLGADRDEASGCKDFMGSALLPTCACLLSFGQIEDDVVFSLKISRCSVRFRNCMQCNQQCMQEGREGE